MAHQVFNDVVVVADETPRRALLRLEANYGPYRVFVTELVDVYQRKYRYYVLRGDEIEAGFDNSPDPRGLRLKYGRIGAEHAGECIPHLHRANKTVFSLTDEIQFTDFVAWVQQHLPLAGTGANSG
jgi:hypothetical protein